MIELNIDCLEDADLVKLEGIERKYYHEGNIEAAHLVGLLMEFVQKQLDEDYQNAQ